MINDGRAFAADNQKPLKQYADGVCWDEADPEVQNTLREIAENISGYDIDHAAARINPDNPAEGTIKNRVWFIGWRNRNFSDEIQAGIRTQDWEDLFSL